MRNKSTIIVIASCCVLLLGAGALCAQDRDKLRTPLPVNGEAIVVNQDSAPTAAVVRQPEAPCQSTMTLLYETVIRYLNDGKEATTEGLKNATQDVVGGDPDLAVITLNEKSQPDVFVGYSCNVEVSQVYATFRVFHFGKTGYQVVARSEDYPVLATRTGEGLSIADGSLEATGLVSPGVNAQASYVSTVWTQGGGRPAPFSVIVWSWDGDTFAPTWKKLEIRNGTVKLVPPLVVVATASKTVAGASDTTAYRLDGDHVVSDGALTPQLLQRYTDSRLLNSKSTEDLANLGYLWESVGQPERAASAYEQAVSRDAKGRSAYLYLAIADIYERTGKATQSAKMLRAYQKAVGGELSSTTKKTIEDRIQRLQRVVPEP